MEHLCHSGADVLQKDIMFCQFFAGGCCNHQFQVISNPVPAFYFIKSEIIDSNKWFQT